MTPAAWRALAALLGPRALVLLDNTGAWCVRAPDHGPALGPVPADALPSPRVECDLDRLAHALAAAAEPGARAFALLALCGPARASLGVRCVGDGDPGMGFPVGIDLDPGLVGEIGQAAWPEGLRVSFAIATGTFVWHVDLPGLAIDHGPRPAGPVDALARAARVRAQAELALAVEPATGAWAFSSLVEPADLAGLVGARAASALTAFVSFALRHARALASRRPLAFDLVRDGAPWHRLWLAGGTLATTAPANSEDALVLGCDLGWVRRMLALPRAAGRRTAAWVETLLPRRLRYEVAEEEVVALVRTRDRSGRSAWLAAGGGEHQLGALWEGEQWRATLDADGQVSHIASDSRQAPCVSTRPGGIAIRWEGEAGPLELAGATEPARPIAWGPVASAAEHGLAAAVLPGSRGTVRLATFDRSTAAEGGVGPAAAGGGEGRALVVATSGLRWRALVEVAETRLTAVMAGTADQRWSAIASVCAASGLDAIAAFHPADPLVVACRWGDEEILPALSAAANRAPRLVVPLGVRAVPLSALATPLVGRARYSARMRVGLVGAGLVGVAVIVRPFEPPRSRSGLVWDERPCQLTLSTGAGGLSVSRGEVVLFEIGIEARGTR